MLKSTKALLYLLLLFQFCELQSQTRLPVREVQIIDWQFCQAGKNVWYKADVPGNIYRDLLEQKLISNPLIGPVGKSLLWVEQSDWEYHTLIEWHPTNAFRHNELVFEGLDTETEVFLNDTLRLKTNNMFRTYTLVLDGHLLDGSNRIRILFHSVSADSHNGASHDLRYPAANDSTSPFVRKAAIQYGWDFAPRMISCGIWKPVRFVSWNDFIIRDLHIQQLNLNSLLASLTASVEIESDSDKDTISLSSPAYGVHQKTILHRGLNHITIPFTIKKPQLWWPVGMGNAHMNEFLLEVFSNRSSGFKRLPFGLRSLELIREPDSLGESFYFRINGLPLYIKGANVVPNPLLSRTETYTNQLFDHILESNINLIRIWGGGVYGDDYLYQFADENGILIWQDFLFSGTLYPGDSLFIDNVSREAADNIIRIRNHPSLALWCGNNEIEVAWKNWGWQKQFQYTISDTMKLQSDYAHLFHTLLPTMLRQLDSGRSYLSSSPVSNWGSPSDFNKGDNHSWGVWHGEKPFREYTMHVPRFASEFGFQALPSLLSLAKFKLEKESDRNLETFKPYQYGAKGNERIEKYMGLYFRKPKDFESFVYVSQLLQAKSLKTAIEAQRQSKPRCMGSVYWQLNDYWPSISWSTVDYYGEQKAGFFAAKRAYAPVLVCGKQENNTCQIYCISDKLNPIQAELIGLVSNFSGKVQSSFRKPVSLKTNSSAQVFSIPLWAPSDKQTSSSSLVQGMHSKDCYISLILVSGKDTLATNTLYFVEEKELELTEPHITCDIQKEDDHFVAKMHSDVLAKDVWLSAGKEGVYSEENYFDLLPGCTKVLRLYSDQSKEELKKSLQIRSLYDSYDPGGNQ